MESTITYLSPLTSPYVMAMIRPRATSLAAVGSGSQLLILDTATFEVVDSVDIAASGNLAFTPDGTRAYAPVPGENAVKVLHR